MKKIMPLAISSLILAYAPLAFSEAPYQAYIPSSAVYIVAGGGVAGILNSDWYRFPKAHNELEIMQPSSSEEVVSTINAALGYQFHVLPIRTEVAYRWFDDSTYKWDQLYVGYKPETGKGSIASQAILFNLYLDFYNITRITPFIGGGIGYYRNRSSFDRITINSPTTSALAPAHHTTNGFSWAAYLGLRYDITENWSIDVRADYIALGDVVMYENNNPVNLGQSPGLQEVMKTDHLEAVSGLVNLTYFYRFLD